MNQIPYKQMLLLVSIAMLAPGCDIVSNINTGAQPSLTPTQNVLAPPPTERAVAAPSPTTVPVSARATNTPDAATKPTTAIRSGIIISAVIAKDVQGSNFDPVVGTNAFPTDQPVYHAVVRIANAPSGTSFKAVWIAVETRGVLPPSTKMGESELKASASEPRNIDLTFKPEGGKLPVGSYKVELYVNGALDLVPTFIVIATGTPPPRIIAGVTLKDDKQPNVVNVVYKPDSTFHAIVRIQNAPPNTKIKALWYATGGPTNLTTPIDSNEVTAEGTRDLDFTLAPAPRWSVGTYSLEIRVNGALMQYLRIFAVK